MFSRTKNKMILLEDDQFGSTGPVANDIGIIVDTVYDEEGEPNYWLIFEGHSGLYLVNNNIAQDLKTWRKRNK